MTTTGREVDVTVSTLYETYTATIVGDPEIEQDMFDLMRSFIRELTEDSCITFPLMETYDEEDGFFEITAIDESDLETITFVDHDEPSTAVTIDWQKSFRARTSIFN